MGHFAQIKSRLLGRMLNDVDGDQSESCGHELARLLRVEQQLKHVGAWDLLEREACSRAQQIMRSTAAAGFHLAVKAQIHCFRQLFQTDNVARSEEHTYD